jgi:hypothetical protein
MSSVLAPSDLCCAGGGGHDTRPAVPPAEDDGLAPGCTGAGRASV